MEWQERSTDTATYMWGTGKSPNCGWPMACLVGTCSYTQILLNKIFPIAASWRYGSDKTALLGLERFTSLGVWDTGRKHSSVTLCQVSLWRCKIFSSAHLAENPKQKQTKQRPTQTLCKGRGHRPHRVEGLHLSSFCEPSIAPRKLRSLLQTSRRLCGRNDLKN